MNVVQVAGLTKRYGEHAALIDVGFEASTGEVVAILGPNGAGKTTTMEILEGFRTRTAGTVRVLGEDPQRPSRQWRTQLGLVLQSTTFDPELTVAETVALYGSWYPRQRAVHEALELVGMASEANAKVGQLSGGQQRRVDLAVGVIGNPKLLFLDEPTTGFDPTARREAWQTVAAMRDAGTTILLTTHYMEEAARLADRVVIIVGGRVVADDRPSTIADQLRMDALISFRYQPGLLSQLPEPIAKQAKEVNDSIQVETPDVNGTLRALLDWQRDTSTPLEQLNVSEAGLEAAYLKLVDSYATNRSVRSLGEKVDVYA